MRFVCRTCSAVQSVVPERESSCASCGARLLSSEPTVSEHVWYTASETGQAGPYDASRLARMFDRGELAWADDVWRHGLRDWRPARKDDALVVALASARGLDAATTRVDAFSRLLKRPDEEESGEHTLVPHEDTVVDVIPAGLSSSWPVRPRPLPGVRPSRTQSAANVLKLATMALLAFVGGGLIVSLTGRLGDLMRPAEVAASPAVAAAHLVTSAPVTVVPSRELVTRALPAVDEVRDELERLAPSARRCVRDARAGLQVELTLVGETGRVVEVVVHTSRLSPGMIECARAVVEDVQVAPFTADSMTYQHHYTW